MGQKQKDQKNPVGDFSNQKPKACVQIHLSALSSDKKYLWN